VSRIQTANPSPISSTVSIRNFFSPTPGLSPHSPRTADDTCEDVTLLAEGSIIEAGVSAPPPAASAASEALLEDDAEFLAQIAAELDVLGEEEEEEEAPAVLPADAQWSGIVARVVAAVWPNGPKNMKEHRASIKMGITNTFAYLDGKQTDRPAPGATPTAPVVTPEASDCSREKRQAAFQALSELFANGQFQHVCRKSDNKSRLLAMQRWRTGDRTELVTKARHRTIQMSMGQLVAMWHSLVAINAECGLPALSLAPTDVLFTRGNVLREHHWPSSAQLHEERFLRLTFSLLRTAVTRSTVFRIHASALPSLNSAFVLQQVVAEFFRAVPYFANPDRSPGFGMCCTVSSQLFSYRFGLSLRGKFRLQLFQYMLSRMLVPNFTRIFSGIGEEFVVAAAFVMRFQETLVYRNDADVPVTVVTDLFVKASYNATTGIASAQFANTRTQLTADEFSFPEAWILRLVEVARAVDEMSNDEVAFALTYCTATGAIRHSAGSAVQMQ
jgi:hypothetical protein